MTGEISRWGKKQRKKTSEEKSRWGKKQILQKSMFEIYQSPNVYQIHTLRNSRHPKKIFGSGGLTLMEPLDPQIPPK